MTIDAELVLLEAMENDENSELQDIGTFKEAQDHLMGFDPDTGELDVDAGMLFPQPTTSFD